MKMKHILLASLLSVGILSVTQSAQAFNPGHYPWGVKVEAKTEKKVDADVQAKVIMHKDENGTLRVVTIEVTDVDVADGILNFMDEKGVQYSEDDKDDTGGGDTGNTGGTDGGDKKDGPKESPAPCDDCWTEDADGKLIYHLDLNKKTDSKGGYKDDNPVGDGTDDGTDLEKSWKRGTK